jgi:hypothetical protein
VHLLAVRPVSFGASTPLTGRSLSRDLWMGRVGRHALPSASGMHSFVVTRATRGDDARSPIYEDRHNFLATGWLAGSDEIADVRPMRTYPNHLRLAGDNDAGRQRRPPIRPDRLSAGRRLGARSGYRERGSGRAGAEWHSHA